MIGGFPTEEKQFKNKKKFEFDIDDLSVSGKNCFGCKDHNKEIMISFIDSENDFIDLFLTQDQAIAFQQRLARQIAFNEL